MKALAYARSLRIISCNLLAEAFYLHNRFGVLYVANIDRFQQPIEAD